MGAFCGFETECSFCIVLLTLIMEPYCYHSTQVVFNKEKPGIERYVASVGKIRKLMPDGASNQQQAYSDAVGLYLEGAAVKPVFDKLVETEIRKRFEKASGGKVGVL